MMLQRSAREKAQYAFDHLLTPLIVDDTGFFIDALNGFPGPYAAYVLNSIGNARYSQNYEGRNESQCTLHDSDCVCR